MAENVRLVDPKDIDRNEENPRLIFHQEELESLEESISSQGILVPLTVFDNGPRYTILDGERRWRCALKLGLSGVPVIVQPKPDLVTNIMMMFAIHKARSDWDPLPTALKLQKLEQVLGERLGKPPTESELGAAASLDRGEVRRYRRILALPAEFKEELMEELNKPRSQQALTVDHVMEATRGAEALRKREVISHDVEYQLSAALVQKFRDKVLKSTVEPRQLPKLARAVDRGEVSREDAQRIVARLIYEPAYTVNDAYRESVAQHEYDHATEQLADRIIDRLHSHIESGASIGPNLRTALQRLVGAAEAVLKRRG